MEVPVTTEDQAGILLRFSGGSTGTLWVSLATAGRKNRLQFEISAASGAVACDSDAPNELWLGHRPASKEPLTKDPALLSPSAAHCASNPGGHRECYPDSFERSMPLCGENRGRSGIPALKTDIAR